MNRGRVPCHDAAAAGVISAPNSSAAIAPGARALVLMTSPVSILLTVTGKMGYPLAILGIPTGVTPLIQIGTSPGFASSRRIAEGPCCLGSIVPESTVGVGALRLCVHRFIRRVSSTSSSVAMADNTAARTENSSGHRKAVKARTVAIANDTVCVSGLPIIDESLREPCQCQLRSLSECERANLQSRMSARTATQSRSRCRERRTPRGLKWLWWGGSDPVAVWGDTMRQHAPPAGINRRKLVALGSCAPTVLQLCASVQSESQISTRANRKVRECLFQATPAAALQPEDRRHPSSAKGRRQAGQGGTYRRGDGVYHRILCRGTVAAQLRWAARESLERLLGVAAT
jgi:hypothetical protein